MVTASGPVMLKANEGVHTSENVSAVGTIAVHADADSTATGEVTVGTGTTLHSSTGGVQLTAVDLDLQGAVQCLGGVILVHGSSPGQGLGLAGSLAGAPTPAPTLNNASAVPPSLTLNSAEMRRMQGAGLSMGSTVGGSLHVAGVAPSDSAGLGAVTLLATRAGHRITFATAPSQFASIVGSAADGVVVEANVSSYQAGMHLNGDSDGTGGHNVDVSHGVTLDAASMLTLEATSGQVVAGERGRGGGWG